MYDDEYLTEGCDASPQKGCLGCAGILLAALALICILTTGCSSSPTEPDECELYVNGEVVTSWACEEEDE